MRVALYIRVSTEEQALHGLSVEAQTNALDEWAAQQRAQVVGHYIDSGLSARKPAAKRPELQRLLRDVEAGRIDLVVFTKLDRWFRNVAEYYKVQEVLERHKVNWRTIHEDYDTSTSSGRLKINIMLAVAQDEADRTSERIKAVFDRKKQRREPVSGGCVALGYEIKDKRYVVQPEEAEIVKDVFKVYTENRSVYVAQRYLSSKYGIHRDISTVKRMLKNTIYAGEMYGIRDFCEPIIDRAAFDHVQEILTERAQRHNYPPANRTYIFKGLVKCGTCGHIMSACVCKGIYYYRCAQRAYVGTCSFAKYVKETDLEKHILGNILTACEEYNVESARRAQQRPEVDEAGIRRKMTKLKDLYLSDLIDREEYERDYAMYRDMLDSAAKLKLAPRPQPIDTVSMRNSLAVYDDLDRAQKKAFWSLIIDKIIVHPDCTFSFTIRHT